MTKTYFYFDTRKSDKRGRYQVKVGIYKNRKSVYIPTGVWVDKENWNPETESVHGYDGSKQDNILLLSTMSRVAEVVSDLRISGRIVEIDAKGIKDIIMQKIDPEKKSRKSDSFASMFEKFMLSKQKPRTRDIYMVTWKHMHRFDPNIDSKSFEDIDIAWLKRFDSFLAVKANKNARNIHFRNIRAVFNYAIDEEITTFYPFRKFKIRPQETAHRALTVEQVRTLRDFQCEPHQEKYRDMFMLMIYLVGINAADLFTPNHAKITKDRIEYFRMKTQKEGSAGKFISVKIEPEAQAILDKYYDSKKGMFTFMKNRKSYKSFLTGMGRQLKKISACKGVDLPEISQYWSRHTWASLAIDIDISDSIVSYAFGHDTRIATTAIYIKVRQKKLDEANRLVIDYINEK